jgi:hypothetical protein
MLFVGLQMSSSLFGRAANVAISAAIRNMSGGKGLPEPNVSENPRDAEHQIFQVADMVFRSLMYQKILGTLNINFPNGGLGDCFEPLTLVVVGQLIVL